MSLQYLHVGIHVHVVKRVTSFLVAPTYLLGWSSSCTGLLLTLTVLCLSWCMVSQRRTAVCCLIAQRSFVAPEALARRSGA